MIFVTGDTHGDVRRFSTEAFPEQKEMTKDDFVVILGDFGLIWNNKQSSYEKYWLEWLNDKPFTTLFIDGNHENHDLLDAMPVEDWHGGRIHRVMPSVIHLMRGQLYEIDGRSVFTFGGAASHDISDGILQPGDGRIKVWEKQGKMFRVNKESWWERELPSAFEFEEGRLNLELADWKVDFVFTHCTASDIAVLLGGFHENDRLTSYFQDIRLKLEYKRWFFGHYHMDRAVTPSNICLFEQIVQIN